jgi:hypothetical protein
MSSNLKPLNELQSRSAIRRDRVGYREKLELVDWPALDLACREFFKSRGLKTGMGNFTYGSKEARP